MDNEPADLFLWGVGGLQDGFRPIVVGERCDTDRFRRATCIRLGGDQRVEIGATESLCVCCEYRMEVLRYARRRE